MEASTAHRATVRKLPQPAISMKELATRQSCRIASHPGDGKEWQAQQIPLFGSRRPRVVIQTDHAVELADKSRRRRIHQRSESRKRRAPRPEGREQVRPPFLKGPWAW